MSIPQDEILTVPEIATLLKVVEKTVYTMAQNAEIPAFKVRGQWRFKRLDIDAWIELRTAVARTGGRKGSLGTAKLEKDGVARSPSSN